MRATHFIGLLAHHVPVFNLLQASGIKCMLPVHNLIRFPPCDFDLIGIRHDHIVTAVNYLLQSRFQTLERKKEEKHTTRVVNWLVLPHKHDCYPLR